MDQNMTHTHCVCVRERERERERETSSQMDTITTVVLHIAAIQFPDHVHVNPMFTLSHVIPKICRRRGLQNQLQTHQSEVMLMV